MTQGSTELNKGNDILSGAGNIRSPKVLAEYLLQNQYTSGIITIPFLDNYDFSGNDQPMTKSIPFYTTNNFSFSLKNKWGENVSSEMLEGLSTMVQYASMLTGGKWKQGNLQSRFMQAASWKSSEIPVFTVSTIFISTSRTINPVKIIQALAAGALPAQGNDAVEATSKATGEGAQNMAEWMGMGEKKAKELNNGIQTTLKNVGMTAPFGYDPSFNFSTQNENSGNTVSDNRTCSLKIGEWFHATDLIIDGIGNIEFSKEVISTPRKDFSYDSANDPFRASGYPLYAKCNITFRPITILTAREFSYYFTNRAKGNSTIVSGGVKTDNPFGGGNSIV